jgi:hemerythrin
MRDKSELITWNSTLSCGIKLIDDQHRVLVGLVNDMFNHVSGNNVQEDAYFDKVIKQVVTYIKVHFATEEKIMLYTRFAGYVEHKKEHDTFVLTVIKNIQSYIAKERFTLLSFTKFLKDWILSHIAVMDKEYFLHLKKIATRKANGKMSITMDDIRLSA